MQTVSVNRSHGGAQGVYRHASRATGTDMTFSVFVPAHREGQKLPIVTYLSGLTCTHANVTEKGQFQRVCAELGLIFVAPDTSPRGEGVPDDPDGAYDFGLGAGFYVDATQAPWAANYRMESYIVSELPDVIAANFPVDMGRQGLTGHSMGGHGALTLALKTPGRWKSVSAFAPIVAPSRVPWGRKAFAGYLGPDETAWAAHDACALVRARPLPIPLLVDQGTADKFLDVQLKPELFEAACAEAGQSLQLRRHPGYDHSYYFIATFVDEHLAHHARALAA